MDLCVVRPGVITSPDKVTNAPGWLASIDVGDFAKVLLNQVTRGFEKDPLDHEDLVRIADEVGKR
jgi:hypothetical protein